MALFGRQVVGSEVYDDQSPILSGLFAGNWTQYPREGFKNSTLTSTPTPGASLSFTFSGAYAVHLQLRQAILVLPWKQGLKRGSMVA